MVACKVVLLRLQPLVSESSSSIQTMYIVFVCKALVVNEQFLYASQVNQSVSKTHLHISSVCV